MRRTAARSCRDDNCPRLVVDDDTDDVYVVGHDITVTDLVIGRGECAVRLTRDEFRELLDQYDHDLGDGAPVRAGRPGDG